MNMYGMKKIFHNKVGIKCATPQFVFTNMTFLTGSSLMFDLCVSYYRCH